MFEIKDQFVVKDDNERPLISFKFNIEANLQTSEATVSLNTNLRDPNLTLSELQSALDGANEAITGHLTKFNLTLVGGAN